MTDIKIGIVVDSTGARRGASEVNASLSEVEKRSKAVGRAIGAALAAFGSIETVRKIAQINDEYAKVEGRLKLVTQGTDQLRATQEQLFQIAQRTGSAYTSVADLYTKVARNAGVLGLAQQQLYDLTTLTNQAIQVGGASASEASAGVIQFSQALASGQLRGDEFRSVMENMPRLANAISDGLGVTIGDLRNLANNGKLTAEVVTKALLSQKDKLASEFSQLPVTVGRSMQQLENAVQRAIADADVSALTTSIAELTKTVSNPSLASGIAALAGGILDAGAAAIKYLIPALTDLLAIQQANTHAIGESSDSILNWGSAWQAAVDQTILFFARIPDFVKSSAVLIVNEIAYMAEATKLNFQAMGVVGERLWNGIKDGAIVAIDATLDEIKRLANGAATILEAVGADRLSAAVRAAASDIGSFQQVIADQSAANRARLDAERDAIIAAQNENKRLRDSVQRQVLEQVAANEDARQSAIASGAQFKRLGDQAGAASPHVGELAKQLSGFGASAELSKEQIEAFNRSLDEHRQLMIEAESLAHDVSDLQRQIELVRSGLSVDQARLAIQEQRLALQAQFNAENEVSHDQNVALLELEKLRAEQTLSALDDSQQAAKQAADEAARAYQRASEEINRSLTDALLRGFEAGKGFAKNFSDTLKNMFETLVLRPTISFIVQPIAQGINGFLGSALGQNSAGGFGGISGLPGLLSAGGVNLADMLGLGNGATNLLADAGYGLGAGALGGIAGYGVGSLLAGHGPFSDNAGSLVGAGSAIGAGIGSVIPGLGTIVGGLAGGVVGALSSAIIGSWKTKSVTLAADFTDQFVDASIVTVKKKKSIFGSKKKTRTDDAESLDEYLSASFSQVYDVVSAGAEKLGLAIGDFSYSVDESIKGLSDDEIQQKITELLTGATDALVQQTVPGIEAFQTADEALIDTLMRVANETTIVTQAADAMGLSFGTLAGLDLAGVADNIIALSGGLDQFTTNFNSYLQGFYSNDERTAILADQLNQQLATLGDTLPDTRDGFRDLVDGLDVTTEAGQQALATLLGLAGQADAYYDAQETAAKEAADTMQKAADDQLAALNDAVSSHTAEFNDAVSQYKDGIEQITKTLQDQLDDISTARGNIGDAVLSVRRSNGFDELGYQQGLIDTLRGQIGNGSIDDQIGTVTALTKAIQDRYSAELQEINSARSAAESLYSTQQQAVESMRDALKGLKDYADSLKLSELSPLTNAARLDEARNQYGRALLQAQRGSDPATISALQAAAGAYLTEARSYNASSTDYTGIFDSVQSELNRVAGRSVSAGLPPNTGVYDQQIADLQGKAVNELLGLQDVLDDISAQANEQAVTQTEELTMTFEQSASDIIAQIAKASADAAAQISEQLADARAQARQIGADNIAALQAVYTSIIQTGSATVAAISAIPPPPPSTAKVA